jgi:hypothetical protein
MIGIDNMPGCGFGNRLIYYYNLRQAAHKKNKKFFCVPFLGYDLFQGNILGDYPPTERYESFKFCLGDKFFEESGISTREVFKLKRKPELPEKVCAIHFRGTDFHEWNPESILKSEYYCDSIDIIKNEASSFILFTDDVNLKSYKNVMKFLEKNNLKFFLGHNTGNRDNYVDDFSIMSECEWIISSPSTFCISAGFIGKKKKIIHSKEWVSSRNEKHDKFWCDLMAAGGNEDYKIWRLV